MALLEDGADRIDSVDQTVSELQDRVEAIHGGWKRLTESNNEINQRIGSVEKELMSVIQILNRLESHVTGDRGKGIASSPHSQTQVPITHFRNEPGSEELGYRSYHNSFPVRDRLLKKIEVWLDIES